VGAPIWTKFGSLMQDIMQITVNWSISKPEVEFQFGLLIEFNLLKTVTSTDTKPEVVFSRRGRHLDKAI